MNCAIGLVSSDEGDMMRDTEPKIEVTDHVARKSTARIGAYRGECTESAVVLEECSGQCDGSIISDSISVRELCVLLENDEETDITRSIGTDHVSSTKSQNPHCRARHEVPLRLCCHIGHYTLQALLHFRYIHLYMLRS